MKSKLSLSVGLLESFLQYHSLILIRLLSSDIYFIQFHWFKLQLLTSFAFATLLTISHFGNLLLFAKTRFLLGSENQALACEYFYIISEFHHIYLTLAYLHFYKQIQENRIFQKWILVMSNLSVTLLFAVFTRFAYLYLTIYSHRWDWFCDLYLILENPQYHSLCDLLRLYLHSNSIKLPFFARRVIKSTN